MTHKKARHIIRWFLKRFNMQDWSCELLYIGQEPPLWVGDYKIEPHLRAQVMWRDQTKEFRVWLRESPDTQEDLFHELVHVALEDVQPGFDAGRAEEVLVSAVAKALNDLYRKEYPDGVS